MSRNVVLEDLTGEQIMPVTTSENVFLRSDLTLADYWRDDISKKRFVCFGDSYLLGYQADKTYDVTQSWGYKLQKRLGIPDSNFIRTGTTGGSFALENGVHWQDQVDSLAVSKPETIDYVILIGGTNDYESTKDNITNNITLWASKCRLKFPNAKLVVGCIVGHTRYWGLDKTKNTIMNYKSACMQNRIAYISGIENTVRHMAYMQSDYIHVTADGQELITDSIENFLLGSSLDLKVTSVAPFSAPDGTTHTFSNNSVITGINNDTAYLKNNLATIVTLNGTIIKFDSTPVAIAKIVNSDIIGRDDYPCQFPISVTIQTKKTPVYMQVNGYFVIKDNVLYLCLYKLLDNGSNWETAFAPQSIIIPPFYFEHTLCMGI